MSRIQAEGERGGKRTWGKEGEEGKAGDIDNVGRNVPGGLLIREERSDSASKRRKK